MPDSFSEKIVAASRSLSLALLKKWDAIDERRRLLLLSVPIGVISGLVACGFRFTVEWISENCSKISHLGANAGLGKLIVVFLPALGAGFSVWLIRRYLKHDINEHGVPSIIRAVSTGNFRQLRKRHGMQSLMSAVVIGSGGSAGPEGPLAELGSCIALFFNPIARVGRRGAAVLVGCGIAGAISGVFSAPLGGFFFALEIILKDFALETAAATVLSAVAGGAVARHFFGPLPAFGIHNLEGIVAGQLPLFLIMGIICGLLSVTYVRGIEGCDKLIPSKWKASWQAAAAGGLAVGLLTLLLPQIAGEGYGYVDGMLHSHVATISLWLLVFAKIAATSFTLGSGAPGGSFAPSLFIGAAAGAAFVATARAAGISVHPLPAYELCAMAGLIAGVFSAPITAVLLLFDVTGGRYEVVLPAMVTVVGAVLTVSIYHKTNIYSRALINRGFNPEEAQAVSALAGRVVRDAMTLPPLVPANSTLHQVLELFAATTSTILPVVGRHERPVGLITLDDLRASLAVPELNQLMLAGELASPLQSFKIFPDDSLVETWLKLRGSKLDAVVVMCPKDPEVLVGILTRYGISDFIYQES